MHSSIIITSVLYGLAVANGHVWEECLTKLGFVSQRHVPSYTRTINLHETAYIRVCPPPRTITPPANTKTRTVTATSTSTITEPQLTDTITAIYVGKSQPCLLSLANV